MGRIARFGGFCQAPSTDDGSRLYRGDATSRRPGILNCRTLLSVDSRPQTLPAIDSHTRPSSVSPDCRFWRGTPEQVEEPGQLRGDREVGAARPPIAIAPEPIARVAEVVAEAETDIGDRP